jgi:serine protease Do
VSLVLPRRPRHTAAIAAALLLAAASLATPRAAAARPGPDGFADLAARLLPAVVNISSTQTLKPEAGEHGGSEMPELPPGSPFEQFFHDFFDHGRQGGHEGEALPRRAA